MQSKSLKTRFIRSLPGRIRIEIYKLKYNTNMANLIVERFRDVEGIYQVSPLFLRKSPYYLRYQQDLSTYNL